MKVLVVYAHYNPDSFTHALLEEVTRGLEDGGHDVRVNDLQASGFDPVFKLDDSIQFIHPTLPEDLLSEPDLRDRARGGGRPHPPVDGGPLARGKGRAELIEEIGKRKPKDVVEQQAMVAEAEGLVFVAPVFWMDYRRSSRAGWSGSSPTASPTRSPQRAGEGTSAGGCPCSPRRRD